MTAPDPASLYPPIYGPNAGRHYGWHAVFLKPLIAWPLTSVGEYTYYADAEDPTGFERNNILFHYGPARLTIGKYCAIAKDVRFIMGAANHLLDVVSTYPFPMFGADWLEHMDLFAARGGQGGDTVVGNDVWFGYRAMVLPGVRIGDGAVVGAGAVVTGDVPPYTVVAGNPATVVRQRFSDSDIERLLRIAWWDWPVERVTANVSALMAADIDALEQAASAVGSTA